MRYHYAEVHVRQLEDALRRTVELVEHPERCSGQHKENVLQEAREALDGSRYALPPVRVK